MRSMISICIDINHIIMLVPYLNDTTNHRTTGRVDRVQGTSVTKILSIM